MPLFVPGWPPEVVYSPDNIAHSNKMASGVYGWTPLQALGLRMVWCEDVASTAEWPCVDIYMRLGSVECTALAAHCLTLHIIQGERHKDRNQHHSRFDTSPWVPSNQHLS